MAWHHHLPMAREKMGIFPLVEETGMNYGDREIHMVVFALHVVFCGHAIP